jgi:hypothetical protein
MALNDYFAAVTQAPVNQQAPPAAPAYMPQVLPSQTLNMQGPTAPGTSAMPNVDYNERMSDSLEHFMDPNSAYIKNARQRGVEMAATRGGVNSSIAAGASERSALDAAGSMAQAAAGMQAGQDQVKLQDWAATQGFNRELYAMPFTSSLNMLQKITDMGLQDPELYSPSVISGFNNFFNQQMNDMMSRYFGGG